MTPRRRSASAPVAPKASDAVLLRAVDFGESDRIVHLLTPELGRVAAIAKGARRSVKRFPGTLDTLNQLRVQVVMQRNTGLARLEQATLVTPHAGLRRDVVRFGLGCYLAELFDRLAPEGPGRDAGPLFHFLVAALGALEAGVPDQRTRLLLELRALAALGLRPQLEACVRCGAPMTEPPAGVHVGEGGPVCRRCARPADALLSLGLGTLRSLAQSLRMTPAQLGRLSLSPAAQDEARLLLLHLRRFHLGVELRSERFLDAVLPGGRRSASA